jgi:hypothetical protein
MEAHATCLGLDPREPPFGKPFLVVSVWRSPSQEELLKEFVELFRDKTTEELDELAQSFLLSGSILNI